MGSILIRCHIAVRRNGFIQQLHNLADLVVFHGEQLIDFLHGGVERHIALWVHNFRQLTHIIAGDRSVIVVADVRKCGFCVFPTIALL